jgi:hypothetical protein
VGGKDLRELVDNYFKGASWGRIWEFRK